MPVLQQYYTSYRNDSTGSAGFQVKAMSPGITPDMEVTINQLIGYSIPPSLDVRAIETHPIALRYLYEKPERSYLLCSQSSGSDDNGRPGNFFAHTLVLPQETFAYTPPIFFWKSPFWRREDAESRSSIASLPTIPSFDEEPSLDPDGVWNFLAREGRRDLLDKLLCAVIQSKRTFRRVVILDTTENVVWWIATVSTLLPPDYRPLLSFATYHHDPKRVPFLITGTTSDLSFGVSPTDYRAFFVLNAVTKETSEIEDFAYAQLATQAAQPDLYDERLLPLFTDYVQRFPPPTTLDEQLDLIALYAGLCRPRSETIVSPRELDAIHVALSSFEPVSEYSAQDRKELNYLQDALAQSLRIQRSSAVNTELGRVEALLKKDKAQNGSAREDKPRAYQIQQEHPASSEQRQNITQIERSAGNEQEERKAQPQPSVGDELKQFIENMLRQEGADIQFAGQLQQRYSQSTLITSVNDPEYISWLTALFERLSSQQLLQVWQSIGKYIQPKAQNQQLLIHSLSVVARLWSQQRVLEGKALLRTMWQTMQENEQFWLRLAVDNYPKFPQGLVELFYYSFASSLDLDHRIPYRNIIKPVSQIILNYEIVADVSSLDARQGLKVIERWIEHAQRNQYNTIPLIALGLTQLQKMCSPTEWRELAPSLLRKTSLAPLPRNIEDQLVSVTFSTLSLEQLSLADLPLYKQYKDHPAIPKKTVTMLSDILSLTKGHLNATQAKRLYEQVKLLEPEEYRTVVKQCMPYFFENVVTNDEHACLVNAFFTESGDHITYFWQTYWDTFKEMLSHSSTTSKFVQMLAFWFSTSPAAFQQAYIVQEFFLQLSFQIKEIQKDRRFQEGIREFNKVAEQQRNFWYPAVKDFFVEKKGLLSSALSALPQLLWRDESQQTDAKAEKEKKSRQELATKIGKLFEGKVLDQHSRRLAELYKAEPNERFWSCYWQKFKEVMTSHEAEVGEAVLTFWFDKAFEKLDGLRYPPQEFFIRLPGMLEQAREEDGRAFRETAHRLGHKFKHALPGIPS